MRILILEDDPLIAIDLQCIVEGCGHEVAGVADSLARMNALIDEAVDFAFLDVDLPDGKSYGIASRLEDRRIPYAFVSASRQGDIPEHLRHARFVAKPYGQAAIRNSLRADQPIAC